MGRARAAAAAPVGPPRTVAQITAMGFRDNALRQRLAAKVLGLGEGGGLVDPHQRNIDKDDEEMTVSALLAIADPCNIWPASC